MLAVDQEAHGWVGQDHHQVPDKFLELVCPLLVEAATVDAVDGERLHFDDLVVRHNLVSPAKREATPTGAARVAETLSGARGRSALGTKGKMPGAQ